MNSINSKKDYHKPMTLYEFKLSKEIAYQDTFEKKKKKKTKKLYKNYIKNYERNKK